VNKHPSDSRNEPATSSLKPQASSLKKGTGTARRRGTAGKADASRGASPLFQGTSLEGFQQLIRRMYFEKDAARGIDGTFMWLMGEVGELAAALRSGTHEERLLEFADVLAWLATIANVAGVDLGEAVARKYGAGCPGCGQFICRCADAEKP